MPAHPSELQRARSIALAITGVAVVIGLLRFAATSNVGVDKLTFAVTIISLAVITYQIALLREDLQYSREQSERLNRRASITLTSDTTTLNNSENWYEHAQQISQGLREPPMSIQLYARNSGNRTIREFKLLIATPYGWSYWLGSHGSYQRVIFESIDATYGRYRLHVHTFENTLLFSNSEIAVDNMWLNTNDELLFDNDLDGPGLGGPILWKVIHEDATEPADPLEFFRMTNHHHNVPSPVVRLNKNTFWLA